MPCCIGPEKEACSTTERWPLESWISGPTLPMSTSSGMETYDKLLRLDSGQFSSDDVLNSESRKSSEGLESGISWG
ncbi:hypothetical protein A2U01_0062659 [Trifolium medium]|uniref:Uncharacterized protein n=1 Tax=Trifolium medium TaxID=97028 RepID=A0A392S0R2_9FABA|nr:hypothetical protein [Trifolium medium]